MAQGLIIHEDIVQYFAVHNAAHSIFLNLQLSEFPLHSEERPPPSGKLSDFGNSKVIMWLHKMT
jgi:hypothetical protein